MQTLKIRESKIKKKIQKPPLESEKKIEKTHKKEIERREGIFQRRFLEELTYTAPIKENEKLLRRLRQTYTEKTIISKIKQKLFFIYLFLLSLFKKSPSRRLTPRAREILRQLKDLAVLYELNCITDEEFIFYNTELGTRYYEIMHFGSKVDKHQENNSFYISKIKEFISSLER